MTEVRCPMCGKANPEDNEVCQYCQARLKPILAANLTGQSSSTMEEPTEEEAAPLSAGETPDWLQDLRHEEDAPEWSLEEITEEGAADLPETEEDSAEFSADLPDWVDDAGGEAEQNSNVEFPPQQPGDDLAESEAALPEQTSGDVAAPIESEMSWLAGTKTGQILETGESQPEPASVPDWLESMRPGLKGIPSPASAQPTEPVESAGPLAGLRGVLAADALISRAHGPATRPTKLRISANQLVHVDLLKELLESEGKSEPLPQKRSISSDHILRWGIALVLCLAVVWAVLFPGQPSALPAYSEETAELYRLIDQLPEGGRVLVAFDYEPGLFAELDAAGYAVLDHLMEKGTYLTLVSTTPLGPILAERFIDKLKPLHKYTAGVQYANLGYVPGGTTGLVTLVGNLPRTLPYTIDAKAAWGNESQSSLPPLEGIQNIGDYALILLLVDDPDVARAWVEQLQPVLSEADIQSSLGMVTSAQLEPVVRPYYDANPRQVHGFVAGLRGGASYARLKGQDDSPQSFWDTYGMGLFVAVLLMLVGGLIYLTYPMLTRPNKPKSEEKA